MTATSGPDPASTAPSSASPPSPRPTSSPVPAAAGEPDWTDQIADLIVDSVDKVRSRTTGPILQVAKGAVYAVVAVVLVIPILALGTVGGVRLLDWAIPGDVWIVYAILGMLFLLVGVVLWSRRKPVT
jgi:hypothetical protein